MVEILVTSKYAQKKVMQIIQKEYPHLNYQTLNKAFRQKDIKINKKWVDKDGIANIDDVIAVYIDNKLLCKEQQIDDIYQDENILIVNKPNGIESTSYDRNKVTLEQEAQKQFGANVRICHRLDTNTCGLCMFAKNKQAYDVVLNAFKNGQVIKEYTALLVNKPPKNYDTVIGYLVKDSKTSFSKIYDKEQDNSLEITTEYEVLEYIKEKNVSLVRVVLHSGKTHQIRAQMKALGAPIVGDSKYGINDVNRKMGVKYQLLYATKLIFNFDKENQLSYLNEKEFDISNNAIESIRKIARI